ncbi:Ppx/GppA phosphatase family protein [Tunicatimonas pelagia]|uniref:Ppx/GppA phosphatase family protein n=1 Tax=Tunicatimonas pelagia TaxID=931531 RepID=UPI0026669601|nr:Ppx/GppA phosphatase family protein [Tunicatimonas pelagia]WKN42442.1 Ppx/GppA phosphatase family protein [Tunicatimonas pelagia]
MKLAAIDIGTNSIHMIVVQVQRNNTFDVIEREKEMVKLGEGVFATNRLSDRAYEEGLEVIRRYVQLADQLGVDEIITAATSATREARNGGEFLDAIVKETGIAPQVISGKEEARLIFLAVRQAIALQGKKALVLDIGGGSTEVVVGDEKEVLFRSSVKLGVRRLLDMFDHQGPIGKEALKVLEAHIKQVARDVINEAKQHGFSQMIGTSGTIRTLGEAVLIETGEESLQSVNAEKVSRADLEKLTKKLLKLEADERTDVKAVSSRRADAIHLGGVLLTQLLQLAEAKEITLCDASLREGLIIDHIQQYAKKGADLSEHEDLRYRSAAQLALKYDVDLEQASHVAALSTQLFCGLSSLHSLKVYEQNILEYAALLHEVGQYISFKRYHKNSRYIIKHARLRGFTNEEILLVGHVARYHRKAEPSKSQKKYRKLSKRQRNIVAILAGILRIATGLNTTKNQLVRNVRCQISKKEVKIIPSGSSTLDIELWAADRNKKVLEEALDRKITVLVNT